MLTTEHFRMRRSQFLDRLAETGDAAFLVAGGEVPRNYPANVVPYRPDSNFLFFFDAPEPGSAALFDPADRSVTLYLKSRTAADALWHGPSPSFAEMQNHHAVDAVEPVESVIESVQTKTRGRAVRGIAVVDPESTELVRTVTGESLAFLDTTRIADARLIEAIGRLRNIKVDAEIARMRETATITTEAHRAAMAHTRIGVTEQELAGIVTGVFARHGCVPAYNNILSVRGEVLHNHRHDNTLREGDIVLLDAGAEHPRGYCSDVTRCWPASGRFQAEAADIYDIVLAAEKAGIEHVRAGVRYRDVHLAASRVLADGLANLGILRGSPDALVESGAHALFFPHGVGHLIGLDVHDMEAFGDAVSYPPGRERSEEFGLAYLRLDIDLEPGICVTVEPGIYFVPAILRDPERRAQFADQVHWDRADAYLEMNDGRGFGGIRIEDDVLCTAEGPDVLTAAMPKERTEVEALVGSATRT